MDNYSITKYLKVYILVFLFGLQLFKTEQFYMYGINFQSICSGTFSHTQQCSFNYKDHRLVNCKSWLLRNISIKNIKVIWKQNKKKTAAMLKKIFFTEKITRK